MAQTNVLRSVPARTNNEGAPARHASPPQELRRTVMACLLWEHSFYESGVTIVDRIKELVQRVKPEDVASIAVEARSAMKLRHVPLLLCRELARNRTLKAKTLTDCIQRADEIAEFLSLYWQDGKCPLAASVKRGLGDAFHKFDEYQLAKYDRAKIVRLRDAMFLTRPKPKDEAQAALWKRLANNELTTPDTWEVALSTGQDKRATWERLIAEKKLGGLALLRNLRNMKDVDVPRSTIAAALESMRTDRILPFRFIAASRAVPGFEDLIEPVMLRSLESAQKLPGRTVLLVDTSPSMAAPLSAKSDLTRMDAAFGLAILAREVCAEVEIVAFSSEVKTVPTRRGFALGDAIKAAVPSNGTLLGKAVGSVSGRYDRLIVMTDEESQDAVGKPDAEKRAYMVNVSNSRNGVGYGQWTSITGWSESIVDYIARSES